MLRCDHCIAIRTWHDCSAIYIVIVEYLRLPHSSVTEGGSSGSALFTVNSSGTHQLRGGLYGGLSFCSGPTQPDYYSRFSDVYTSISTYFAP